MKTKFKTKKNNLNRNVFLPAAVLAVILAGFIIVIVKDAKAAVVCQYCDTQRPTTLDATEITGNSATLNGSVAEWQRSGPTQNVYVGFFYRPSPQSNYNFTGWAATVPEGAGPYSFSLTVNSLIPNTTYYFRAYVYVDDSSSGPHDQEGLERTFQTPPPLSYSLSCTNSCNFAGIAGGANPVDQTLTITNTDTRSVNWTAATNGPRVTVSPASGSTAAGASSSATVSFDTSGTPPGSYNNIGIITITAEGISKTMPVNLSIGEPLTITQSVWNIFKKSDLETPITGFPKTFAGKADLIVSGSSVGEGSFQANLLIINSADRAAATVQDFFVIPAQPPPAPLPGPPPNPINSVCEQLTVSWIDVAGETG
ncbi:MAG: hypothetical protein U1E51_11545, partial [Candidatus Binatia bacterium]|nr:hypothetical protein [Candidatus Binatia bacterium]